MKKTNKTITISEKELISLIETIVNRKIKKALNERFYRDSDDSDYNDNSSDEEDEFDSDDSDSEEEDYEFDSDDSEL